MPRSYACLTLRISVTVSAISTSAAGASRPVTTTDTFDGRSRRVAVAESPSIHPQFHR
jgi:outer membrane protein OmpA-like peptidoglycan-associated protein